MGSGGGGGVLIFVWPRVQSKGAQNGEVKEKRCNLGPLVTPEERFVRYQAEQKRNLKNEEEEGKKRQSEREKNADVPYSEPSLIRHPLHHPPDPPNP